MFWSFFIQWNILFEDLYLTCNYLFMSPIFHFKASKPWRLLDTTFLVSSSPFCLLWQYSSLIAQLKFFSTSPKPYWTFQLCSVLTYPLKRIGLSFWVEFLASIWRLSVQILWNMCIHWHYPSHLALICG